MSQMKKSQCGERARESKWDTSVYLLAVEIKGEHLKNQKGNVVRRERRASFHKAHCLWHSLLQDTRVSILIGVQKDHRGDDKIKRLVRVTAGGYNVLEQQSTRFSSSVLE